MVKAQIEVDHLPFGKVHQVNEQIDQHQRGKIVAVGKGKILENGEIRPLDVKVNDEILFGKYSGTEIKVDGEDLVVMREDDVMAIIEKK